MANTLWILIIFRVILTVLTFGFNTPILQLLGAEGQLLSLSV